MFVLEMFSFDVDRQEEEAGKSIKLFVRDDRGVDFLRNLTPLEATPSTSPTMLSAEFWLLGLEGRFSSVFAVSTFAVVDEIFLALADSSF